MLGRLRTAPRWALTVFNGVTFGLFTGVFAWIQQGNPIASLLTGVFGGAFFGAVMGPFTARQRDAALAAAGPLPEDRQRTLQRQLLTGRVPEGAEGRAAAARVLRHQQVELRRWRPLGLVLFPAMLVLAVVLAVTDSTWYWLAAVLFLGLLVMQFVAPRRLGRKLARLER